MKASLWFIIIRKTVMEESTLFILGASDFSAPFAVSPSFFFFAFKSTTAKDQNGVRQKVLSFAAKSCVKGNED